MKIIAYIFDADIICPDCISKLVGWSGADAETVLDALARRRGIDRHDEHSFDSDDFPKVVFSTDDQCGECGDDL